MAASAGCTIERDLPRSRFACELGGPCDGGINLVDGAIPDGGAPSNDAALPSMTCASAVPLSGGGVEMGTFDVEENDHNGVCNTMGAGGLDKVFYFYSPGRLETFAASTERSIGQNTVLYLYRNECTFGTDLACNDDVEEGETLTSVIEARNLSPGAYYVVVDGFNNSTAGAFRVDVSGTIAPDERCDPALSFLRCARSYCDTTGTETRCLPAKDCPDMLDNDFDADTDEDVCTGPPIVTCPRNALVTAGDEVVLTGNATDDGRVIGSGWELISGPLSPYPFSFDSDARTATITVELAGRYVLRYSAADDQRQGVGCEVTIDVRSPVPLRTEVIFVSRTPSDRVDVDSHFLDPMAAAWFDQDFDCAVESCTGEEGLPWGGARHLGDSIGSPGLEITELSNPRRDGQGYELGAVYYESAGLLTDVYARIHCDGMEAAWFGPTLLDSGDPSDQANDDFWKIAQIVMLPGGGCTVTPRDVVVTRAVAEMGR